jgi:hypothetical protein
MKSSFQILLILYFMVNLLAYSSLYRPKTSAQRTPSGNPRSHQWRTSCKYLQAFISVPFVVTFFPGKFRSQGHDQEVDRVGDDHIVVHCADDVHNQDGESSAWQKTSYIGTPKHFILLVGLSRCLSGAEIQYKDKWSVTSPPLTPCNFLGLSHGGNVTITTSRNDVFLIRCKWCLYQNYKTYNV